MVGKKGKASLDGVSQKKRRWEEELAEQARRLAASGEQYRTLFENAGDALLVIEEDTTIAMVNRRFEEMMGYRREEVEGKLSFLQLVPEEERERMLDMHRRRRESPQDVPSSYRVEGVNKEGRRVLGHASVALIPGTRRSLVAVRDITETHRLQEELAASEQRYRALFESAGDALAVVEADGTYSMVNARFEELTGYSKEEIEGKMSVPAFTLEEDVKKVLRVRQQRLAGKSVTHHRSRIRCKDGQVKYVEATAALIPGTQRSFVSFRDITEAHRLQEKLAASEEHYRALFENAGDALAVVEADGTMSMVNSRFEEFTGYSREEVDGRMTVADLVSEEDLEEVLRVRRRRLEGEPVTYHQNRMRCKDGTLKWAGITGVLIPGTQRSFVSYRDITEARRLQEELARRNRELEALHGVAALASRSASPDSLLALVLDKVLELTGQASGQVYLVDEEQQRLFIRAHKGSSPRFLKGVDGLQLGEGFGGRVAQTGQALFIRDISKDLRLARPAAVQEGIRSLACVPLVSGGKVLGVMTLGGTEVREFSPEEQRLLESLGNEIGVAVERARLYQEASLRARDLEALNAVAATLSRAGSLGQVLEKSLATVVEVMQLRGGVVLLLDEARGRLLVRAAHGLSREFISGVDGLQLGEAFSGQVAQTGQPIFVEDVRGDPRLTRGVVVEEGLRRGAFIPLVSEGKVLGVLAAAGQGARQFSPTEQRLLLSIGNQIGVAVERALLFQRAQERAQELEALASVGRELVSTLNLEAVLDKTLATLCQQVGASHGFLSLLDEGKGELMVKTFWGETITPPRRVWKVGEGVVGWVAQHGGPLLCDDLATDPRIQGSQGPARGFLSTAAVPLKVKDRLLGVVVVAAKERGAFTEAHLRLLLAYAADAAIALENALLHEEVRRLAATDELTRLANRRALYQHLGEELRRVKRYQRPLALLFADVDDLKAINDRYGHLQGDVLLRHVAATLLRGIRETDLAARFGGDEFVVILPETEKEEAQRVVERLLAGVAPCEMEGGKVSWSMSIGIAWLPVEGSYDVDLLRLADEASYWAKRRRTRWAFANRETGQVDAFPSGGSAPPQA